MSASDKFDIIKDLWFNHKNTDYGYMTPHEHREIELLLDSLEIAMKSILDIENEI